MANKKKNKKKNKENKEQIVIINNIQPSPDPSENLRTINLYGDISERTAGEVVSGLLYLESTAVAMIDTDQEQDPIQVSRDINLYLSTHGGTASDMFSIVDVMEMIKKRTCDINTHGLGKVMSAGVLILAAGTKGKRKIGKNCRVMLHNVSSAAAGTIATLEGELEEVKWIQERYIHCLSSYTKLTKAKLRKLLKAQKDIYISAEEAINLGIADEIS